LIIPYFNPARRNLTFSLLLLLALLLLVLTGLGVFRLYFSFDWAGDQSDSGQLFNFSVRGGNSYNLFDAAPFGSIFWSTQLITLILAIVMPWFRLIGGSILAVLAALGIFALHLQTGEAVPSIPLEFELLIVLILYILYVLLQYFAEIRDRKRFANVLSQYVPPELAAAYSRDPSSMGMDGEEREISVLFCDVVGFSAVTEQLESKQVAQWLNGFFTLVSKIVVRHRGTIDKFMGDSVMAVWGAPAPTRTHAFDALSAAMDIQNEIDDLNTRFQSQGMPGIRVGVGVSTGLATVGPLGSEYRMDYTVVGDSVNIAQRLEEQTRKYQVPVIVSDKTADALPDMLFRELDTVAVKGRKNPVTMYQPLGLSSEADVTIKKQLTSHRIAMEACESKDWAKAEKIFTQLRDEWGPAEMYDLYLSGIKQASK
jgi:adenylate cyclase